MSDTLYGYSISALKSNNSDTVRLSFALGDGTLFTVIETYSNARSKAVIALIVASCISLVATVGLLAEIAMSAFNTRTIKNPNIFVRTHVAFYFVSLLLSDILQSISSIIGSAWVREGAVVYGSLCTAQGVLKHMSDVGIALWSLVIATRTFSVLFLRLDTKHYEKWIVSIAQWSLIGAIVIGGPATARTDEHGPYYGIAGDWCWIAANYTTQRIVLDYMIPLFSAVLAFILYSFVFLKLRGIVRKRASTIITSANEERTLKENYEHRLARQMLLFPIAYAIMIVPLTLCRLLAMAGHDVPIGLSVFSDFTYLLGGLVHVILFACTGRILPANSVLPRFTISRPKILLASTAVASSDFDCYYGEAVTRNPKCDIEKRDDAFLSSITETADPRNPFADPVLPPIDESIIKRVGSPDSDFISADQSPHRAPLTLSFTPSDYYIYSSFLPEPSSPLDGTRLEQGPAV